LQEMDGVEIQDTDTVYRFLRPMHVKGGRAKPNAFVPPPGSRDLSVDLARLTVPPNNGAEALNRWNNQITMDNTRLGKTVATGIGFAELSVTACKSDPVSADVLYAKIEPSEGVLANTAHCNIRYPEGSSIDIQAKAAVLSQRAVTSVVIH